MGKRGPKPKGEYGHKADRSAVVSARFQKDTLAALRRAVKASGRSLSQEVEHRLRQTFNEEDKETALFGDTRTAAILRLIGVSIQATSAALHPDGEWLDEAPTFDAVIGGIVSVLEPLRPEGPWDPDYLSARYGRRSPEQVFALQILEEIAAADPSLDLARRSDRDRVLIRLRERLGDLAGRAQRYDEEVDETGKLKTTENGQ
jgi:hypothetical protein